MGLLLPGTGKMDFAACQSKKLAKKVKVDENLIENFEKSIIFQFHSKFS